ncbi:MAG: DUF4300 family protein [Lachnospiraceae bacterium]|nr:DUF4300 family protein [Lachnospiraceae bacterium]
MNSNSIKKIFLGLTVLTILGCTGCTGLSGSQKKSDAALDTAAADTAADTETSEEAASESENSGAVSFTCEYTNLADDSSCNTVEQLLADAGISKERRDVFLEHVEQFNSSVDRSLLKDGFGKADILSPDYDPYDLQEQWMEKQSDFDGYNCRITAFGLFGDYLDIDSGGEIRDEELFMDKEALDEDNSVLLREGDLDAFCRLFSTIPAENTKDISMHVKTIQEDWKNRGIHFADNDKVSLITVWFHDRLSEDENELFIGHTGVLLTAEEGLYFIEKLAFQEPYQVIRFESKTDLDTYLMKKYDTSWGQETAPPFVMENDRMMQ